MIRAIKTLFFAAILIVTASCTKDTLDVGDTLPPVPEGYIRASLGLNVSENEQVKTRATDADEKGYDDTNVWVLMFNATSASDPTPTSIIQLPSKATKIGTKLYALLRATTQPVIIYVVTGLTATQNAFLGTATNFTLGTTNYGAISNASPFQTANVTATGIPVGAGSYFPMCTDRISYATGTTLLTEITASFRRIVAKIDVDASALNTADFALEGITLINGARRGIVLPQSTLPINNGTVVQYNENNTVTTNKILSQVYLYENNGTANPTKVVIRGKYKGRPSSYYRMDLHRESAPGVYTPYDINRNKHYTIVINEIQNGGYASINEAAANKPSNAKYTVTVTEPDSHDIVSNGEYYLGVSNSEYVSYSSGTSNSLLAVTVTHNAPASVVVKSVTVSGGLTAVTSSLGTLDGTVRKVNVFVTLPSTFTTSSTGTITIQLGNLTKTIKVTRKPSLPAVASVITDFSGAEYVTGTIENSGAGDWLKLSAQPDGSSPTSVSNKTVASPLGGIYLAVPDNIQSSGGLSRSDGSFFVSRSTDQGRVRVAVEQNVINTSTDPTNPLQPMYVGAFWKANQTGERLMRMQVNGSNTGAWRVKVLDNADWIALDTQNSSDPNIGWKPGANESFVADMNTADASYQVSGSETLISGTAPLATDYIYFRIGLKSTYTATPTNPARYARLLLTYNNNTKWQILYLRQGEEADYLFRQADAYGNNPGVGSAGNWRPNAQKFSPYNLTSTNLNSTAPGIATALRGGIFASYPTQAGAHFQWASATGYERRAYHPTNPPTGLPGFVSGFPFTYWDTVSATYETCPVGYHRPNDGIINASAVSGVVLGSEYRQSLYLSPQTDQAPSNTNSIWGYYADGFFDRRAIQDALGTSAGTKSAVYNSSKDAAYIGRLYFNSNNNASIFFPASGYRNASDGVLTSAGATGYYSSSSSYDNANSWYLSLISSSTYQTRFSRGFALSIRCVRP